jgi:hypothetical protein
MRLPCDHEYTPNEAGTMEWCQKCDSLRPLGTFEPESGCDCCDLGWALEGDEAHQRIRPKNLNDRPPDGRCPDCGKLRYRTRTAAKRAARQGQQKGLAVTRVYKCGESWHLTSQDTATTTMQRERAQ